MIFSDKLIYLMSLTNTSNKQLSIVVSLDPSLISRLRNGRRGLPQNLDYVKVMAKYFAQKITTDYQRSSLAETIGQNYLKLRLEIPVLSENLYHWMINQDTYHMKQFLTSFKQNEFENICLETTENHKAHNFSKDMLYYGNTGKREAVRAMMEYGANMKNFSSLYITSDENMEWTFEDPLFTEELFQGLKKITEREVIIKRIAPPIYTVEEVFESLNRWLSLYVTGKIESYYYPRIRDNVYHRTLFIIPNEIALASTSVGYQPDSRATLLTKNKRLINAYEGEFNDFLKKCQPMTTTYTNISPPEKIFYKIINFYGNTGSIIQSSINLSSFTTPPDLIEKFIEKKYVNLFLEAQKNFEKDLLKNRCIDIINIDDLETILSGKVIIPSFLLLDKNPIYYSPQEYRRHLTYIIYLLENYPKYHVLFQSNPSNYVKIAVKEGEKVLIIRPNPFTIFEINEKHFISASTEYLLRSSNFEHINSTERLKTISNLKRIINEVKEAE